MTCGTTDPSAPAAAHADLSHDIGTCWTLTRAGAVARCALFTAGDAWELRVSVNAAPLLWKRCRRAEEVSEVADDWKNRMLDDGWTMAAPDKVPLPVRRNGSARP